MGEPMQTFEVWYRRKTDGQAPSVVFLADDYDQAGDIEARSLAQLQQRLLMSQQADADSEDFETEDLRDARPLKVGDVVRQQGAAWILTPTGVWAQVDAFID